MLGGAEGELVVVGLCETDGAKLGRLDCDGLAEGSADGLHVGTLVRLRFCNCAKHVSRMDRVKMRL